MIDRAGVIHQLVPLEIMCRHTVGLNWTAIGIEHVGYSDWEVLDDTRQMSASLRLVRWLRCRYHIPIRDVIGHNESLSSPYHREDVPSLRTQTHSDFDHADMNVYRRPPGPGRRLRGQSDCGSLTLRPRAGAEGGGTTGPMSPSGASSRSTITGAWSLGREPLRALRSTHAAFTRSLTASPASTRSMRMPRSWWNMPAR